MKTYALVLVALCLVMDCSVLAVEATGPPPSVPYKAIPDPQDNAERHIVVKAEDRGPVWLLTGWLNGWGPDIELETMARVKPTQWRYDMWPFWQSGFRKTASTVDPIGVPRKLNYLGFRESPVAMGKFLETILSLRERGMAFKTILHWGNSNTRWIYDQVDIFGGGTQDLNAMLDHID